MKDRYRYEIVQLTIEANQNADDTFIDLPGGKCIAMNNTISGTRPPKGAYLGLYENGGQEVVKPLPYQNYERTSGGTWLSGLMPHSFDCNRRIQLRLTTPEPLAEPFTLDVLFVIENLQ